VSYRPRVDWSTIPLGQKSDADIAREYGFDVGTVRGARNRRGIPTFGSHAPSAPKNIDWDNESRLGQMPDGALAAELGCSLTAVARARTRRGIPSYASQHRKAKKKKKP
jgi:hypothetical protein